MNASTHGPQTSPGAPSLRIAFAAGGTGGHVFPAMAVIDALRRRDADCEIAFAGRAGGLEERESRKREIDFLGLNIRGLRRRLSADLVLAPAQAVIAVFRCLVWLRRFRPDWVIGFGGYASAPAVLAAVLLRRRTAIHEQNAAPGLANRMLTPLVDRVFVSDPASASGRKSEYVGLPIRDGVTGRDRAASRQQWNLDPETFTILVFGGSLGARALCRAAVDAFHRLAGSAFRFQAILQTGKASHEEIRALSLPAGVQVLEFIEDMGAAYAAADLVVARAGAVSIAEITANGLPAILVPFPFATGRHQHQNARVLEDAGAAVLLDESDLTGASLAARIEALAGGNTLADMAAASRALGRPDAADRLLDRLLGTPKASAKAA